MNRRHSATRFRVIPIIIAINILIYAYWQASLDPKGLFGFKGDLLFMTKNFFVSGALLEQGAYWTLISSVFSHNNFLHLLLNMFVLNSFGPIIERIFGLRRFLLFYLVAGAVSSLAHCLASEYLLHDSNLRALGASGSIAGLIALFSLMFPKQKMLVFAIIPIPAILGVFLLVGFDIWGLMAQTKGHGLPIGHGAHLGGAFAGFLYFVYLKMRAVGSKTI